MDEIVLTTEQEKEWRKLARVVRCFHELESPYEVEVWKRYHFDFPLPSHQTYIQTSHELIPLLLKPELTSVELESAIRTIKLPARGARVGTWIGDIHGVFNATGYEMFPGRTERIMELLLEGKDKNPEEWFRHFRYGVLLEKIAEWLREGGYRRLPVVPVFPVAIEAFALRVQTPDWNESLIVSWRDFFRRIFHFKDPESLPREESPYYYFASRAQHYLCNEAQLPEPLEQYIIQAAKLKVSRLSEFKCLPILPRPACYDAKPVVVEPAKAKAKKKGVEEDVYDEVYPAPDEDYPRAPLRYVGEGTVSGKETVELVLALFKQRKFIARLPKVSEGDPASDLSHAVLKKPPKEKTKAWIAEFKPHTRFAMSDELDLSVRILASVTVLPVATTVFEWDEDTGEPCDIEVKEEQCNLALYIKPSQGEEIPDDSTLAKNIQTILAEIKKTLGIDLHECVPPEHVPEG